MQEGHSRTETTDPYACRNIDTPGGRGDPHTELRNAAENKQKHNNNNNPGTTQEQTRART